MSSKLQWDQMTLALGVQLSINIRTPGFQAFRLFLNNWIYVQSDSHATVDRMQLQYNHNLECACVVASRVIMFSLLPTKQIDYLSTIFSGFLMIADKIASHRPRFPRVKMTRRPYCSYIKDGYFSIFRPRQFHFDLANRRSLEY